jgi:hypothetical protein
MLKEKLVKRRMLHFDSDFLPGFAHSGAVHLCEGGGADGLLFELGEEV